MEVYSQYIVKVDGKWQILYATAIRYFITTDDGYLKEVTDDEAWKLRDIKTLTNE